MQNSIGLPLDHKHKAPINVTSTRPLIQIQRKGLKLEWVGMLASTKALLCKLWWGKVI